MDDDFDGKAVLCLKCDLEMDLQGPNDATLNRWAADALRRLAELLERNELESGHHKLKDNVGKIIGTVYVDYYGHDEEI